MTGHRHRNFMIRGVTYATTRDAALALGVGIGTVQNALAEGRADDIGLRGSGPQAMPVRVRGKVYANVAEAARDLGLARITIYHAIYAGRENEVGLNHGKRGRKPRAVLVGGLQFASQAEAERTLGLSRGYIASARRYASSSMNARIMAAAMALQARQEAAQRRQNQRESEARAA